MNTKIFLFLSHNFAEHASMNTGAIPNLGVTVWTRNFELSQGGLLCYLTQPKVTIQRHF